MDAMTNELRRVMIEFGRTATLAMMHGNETQAGAYCVCLFNFAGFGETVGLITHDESEDWKAVANWKRDLPEVMERWQGIAVLHGSTSSEIRDEETKTGVNGGEGSVRLRP